MANPAFINKRIRGEIDIIKTAFRNRNWLLPTSQGTRNAHMKLSWFGGKKKSLGCKGRRLTDPPVLTLHFSHSCLQHTGPKTHISDFRIFISLCPTVSLSFISGSSTIGRLGVIQWEFGEDGLSNYFSMKLYLFLQREEVREKEKERNIDVREKYLHPTQGANPQPRHSPGMCSDQESN